MVPGTREGEGKAVRTLDSGFILKKKLERIKFPDGLYRTCERKRRRGAFEVYSPSKKKDGVLLY